MNKYLVSYDLIGPDRDYEAIKEKLRSYSPRAKPLESVWIIKTDKSAEEIRDDLKTAVDSNDKLLVVKLSGNWATRNISVNVTDWMKNQM